MKISLMTGCNDKHYQLGLLSGLVAHGIEVDFIANDDMRDAGLFKNVRFINIRSDRSLDAPLQEKISRIIRLYFSLIAYAARTDTGVFHIQWLNKFIVFERTLLNLYYKMLGKKLIFTAHNINDRVRDGRDTILNRLSLKFMYSVMDHIIVHTEQMKRQLIEDFHVDDRKISVIPHGIHDAVYQSDLTREAARKKLGLEKEKIVLFFGNIAPYKGLEYAVLAIDRLKKKYSDMRLVIAGRMKKNENYWKHIENTITERGLISQIISRIEFIPDEEVEVYYKAADLSILPYIYVFQSGVLFMSYNFGIPVVATDVGSMREEIIEGQTGFVCRPQDPADLADKIDRYFQSDLYRDLEHNRSKINAYAREKYSWSNIGEKTYAVYKAVLNGKIT